MEIMHKLFNRQVAAFKKENSLPHLKHIRSKYLACHDSIVNINKG